MAHAIMAQAPLHCCSAGIVTRVPTQSPMHQSPRAEATGTEANSIVIPQAEKRMAGDGLHYTYIQFESYYGRTPRTVEIWNSAQPWQPKTHSQARLPSPPAANVVSSHVEAREANVPGPHEQRRYKTVSIRGGNNIWREFKLATHLDNCDVVSLLDKHDAVDNMTRHEAVNVGVDLDHMEYVCTLLCSYGRDQRLQAFDRSQEWYPMVTECDGYTFTDYRVGTHPSVDIYREEWMPIHCIGVRGDKGQLAQLTRKPCILLDDKEENIDLLRYRSTQECPLDGVVIRTGRKRNWNVKPGYVGESNNLLWPEWVRRFSLLAPQ